MPEGTLNHDEMVVGGGLDCWNLRDGVERRVECVWPLSANGRHLRRHHIRTKEY